MDFAHLLLIATVSGIGVPGLRSGRTKLGDLVETAGRYAPAARAVYEARRQFHDTIEIEQGADGRGNHMQSHVPGVMAAPNSARVKARILRVTQSEQYPDKWALELEILEAQNVSGPNFVRVGEKVNGFTLLPAWTLPVPVTVKATAEYIGDAQRGLFQLTDLHPCD